MPLKVDRIAAVVNDYADVTEVVFGSVNDKHKVVNGVWNRIVVK